MQPERDKRKREVYAALADAIFFSFDLLDVRCAIFDNHKRTRPILALALSLSFVASTHISACCISQPCHSVRDRKRKSYLICIKTLSTRTLARTRKHRPHAKSNGHAILFPFVLFVQHTKSVNSRGSYHALFCVSVRGGH
jgi:hypothetical protein